MLDTEYVHSSPVDSFARNARFAQWWIISGTRTTGYVAAQQRIRTREKRVRETRRDTSSVVRAAHERVARTVIEQLPCRDPGRPDPPDTE